MNRIKEYLSLYFRQDSFEKRAQFLGPRALSGNLDYHIFQATHAVIFDPAIERSLDWKKL